MDQYCNESLAADLSKSANQNVHPETTSPETAEIVEQLGQVAKVFDPDWSLKVRGLGLESRCP